MPPPLDSLAAFWWRAAVNVIGVGADLVDLGRVARLLSHKGEHAMVRSFSPTKSAPTSPPDPIPTGHAAARIAAKEAVYKALQSLPGARAVGWREIEVTRDGDGRPAIRLHGLALRLAEEAGGVKIQVSLTHSSLSAGAVAVVSAPAGAAALAPGVAERTCGRSGAMAPSLP